MAVSPLWKESITGTLNMKKITNSPTLRVQNVLGNNQSQWFISNRKGILLSASRHLQASMTVEAAMIIPLLLFLFLNLMSVMEMYRLHSKLELALWKYGKVMSVGSHILGDAQDAGTLLEVGAAILTDAAVYLAVSEELGEDYLENSPLTYGKKGLNFLKSSYMEEDCIDIRLVYRVSPEFQLPGFRSFWMVNRYYARAWTGYCVADKAEAAVYVYVTTYGQVYHEKLECSHLKRTIEAIGTEQVGSWYNRAGNVYSACELCEGDSAEGTVYITPEGDCYHSALTCGALKRTIQVLDKETAEASYRACSRCGDK